jgi:hypothetical protein
MMILKSLKVQAFIFSLDFLNFLRYLPILLFVFSLLFYLADPSIAFCMEHDCNYVVNNDGNVQLHPKTGEPLQNCKTTKSDLALAMENIERLAREVGAKNEAPSTSATKASSDI